jgi:hypothetical protein
VNSPSLLLARFFQKVRQALRPSYRVPSGTGSTLSMTQSSAIMFSSMDPSCCTNAWLNRFRMSKVSGCFAFISLSSNVSEQIAGPPGGYTCLRVGVRLEESVPRRTPPNLIHRPEFFAGWL